MKKRLLPLVLALVLCLGLTVPALAEEAKSTEDRTFAEVIPCERSIGPVIPPSFHEGLACVWEEATSGAKYESKFGFMDKTGEIVIPCVYDDIDGVFYNFSGGLAAVRLDGKWGFIDKTGKEVIPFQYDYAMAFSDGLAAVLKNDKWGYINQKGEEVIPCQYVNGREIGFSEGLAGMEKNNKWGFIDKTGEEAIPFMYDGVLDFSEGLAGVMKNGKCGYINKTGEEIIPCKYDDNDNFYEGLARVQKNDKYGFIDKTGEEVIPCKYDSAGCFSSGLAPVLQDEKWGYIDKTGAVVVPFQYSAAGSFSEGFAAVRRIIRDSIACGYIDKTGKEVVPCKIDAYDAPDRYVYAYTVSDGMAAVERLKLSSDGDGYLGMYGYIAFPAVEEAPSESETPAEPVEITAAVSAWAKEQVDSAAASGLIADGLGDDYTRNITRAQFAAVSVKLYEAMSGQTAPVAGDSPFTDTSDPVVIQAEALGFVGGVGGGKFEPASLVTREQAATMLSRVYTKLGGEIPAVDATDFADDADMSGYAREAIAFMSSKEIVGGVGNNKFDPQGNASIEQALVIALRMFEKLK